MADGQEGERKTRCVRPGCHHPIEAHELVMAGRSAGGSQVADRGRCNTEHCDCPRYLSAEMPIDADESMGLQSRHALMLAELFGLLIYRYPVDMRDPEWIETLRHDLGEDANIELPTDDGVYYFVIVETDDGVDEARQAILAALHALNPPTAESDFEETARSIRSELEQLRDARERMEAPAFRHTVRQLEQRLWAAAVGASHDQAAEAATWLQNAHAVARWGRLPMLIREGEARGFVVGRATKAGRETVEKIRYYHGLLPK